VGNRLPPRRGIDFELVRSMTFDLSRRMLRWTFRRGNTLLTCVIDRARGGRGYQLAVVPQLTSEAARIELFHSPSEVLMRHATIARELRDEGWTLVAYTDRGPRTPQQHPLTALAA
jgi:hypothetical protein